jgi:hypothetical protein
MKDRAAGSKAFDALIEAFASDGRVAPPRPDRREFGSNALKVDGRIFAMLVNDALVVKLPRERVAELIAAERGEPFDAGKGRPMKEWVRIRAHERAWLGFAREARRFVGG